MTLSNERLSLLLKLIANTEEEPVDCDACLSHVAQFADQNLRGLSPQEQLETVQTHLKSCPCCQEEFQYLMKAIQALDAE